MVLLLLKRIGFMLFTMIVVSIILFLLLETGLTGDLMGEWYRYWFLKWEERVVSFFMDLIIKILGCIGWIGLINLNALLIKSSVFKDDPLLLSHQSAR